MICESPIVRWTAKEQDAHDVLVDSSTLSSPHQFKIAIHDSYFIYSLISSGNP